jgi:hypothetical protein
MKTFRNLILAMLPLLTLAPLQAQITETYSYTNLNLVIPDGSSSGLAQAPIISGSTISSITDVRFLLNLGALEDADNAFNGDLYLYLQHGSALSVLLNRPGVTGSNPFGYGDNGMVVTFADSAANGDIHNYQNLGIPPEGSPLYGVWQPDGRTADPNSVTDASVRSAFLHVFDGMGANGQWTVFVADLSTGGLVRLNSFSIQITGMPVPEPGSVALLTLGAALLVKARRKIQRRAH